MARDLEGAGRGELLPGSAPLSIDSRAGLPNAATHRLVVGCRSECVGAVPRAERWGLST
jgi:hypothetical protein